MNQATTERSNFITALAWIFIVLGGFTSLIAIAQNVMLHLVFPLDEVKVKMAAGQGAEHFPAFARFMLENFELFFGAFLLVSLATFISALGLLKRREWARLTFIGLMMLGVVWNLTSIALQQVFMSQMPIPPHASPEFRQEFATMQQIMMVISAVFGLAFAGLFGWIAWRLRTPSIVAEFRSV